MSQWIQLDNQTYAKSKQQKNREKAYECRASIRPDVNRVRETLQKFISDVVIASTYPLHLELLSSQLDMNGYEAFSYSAIVSTPLKPYRLKIILKLEYNQRSILARCIQCHLLQGEHPVFIKGQQQRILIIRSLNKLNQANQGPAVFIFHTSSSTVFVKVPINNFQQLPEPCDLRFQEVNTLFKPILDLLVRSFLNYMPRLLSLLNRHPSCHSMSNHIINDQAKNSPQAIFNSLQLLLKISNVESDLRNHPQQWPAHFRTSQLYEWLAKNGNFNSFLDLVERVKQEVPNERPNIFNRIKIHYPSTAWNGKSKKQDLDAKCNSIVEFSYLESQSVKLSKNLWRISPPREISQKAPCDTSGKGLSVQFVKNYKGILGSADEMDTESREWLNQLLILEHLSNQHAAYVCRYYLPELISQQLYIGISPLQSFDKYAQRNWGTISLSTKLYMLYSTVQVLRFLSKKDVAHCRVKPDNILVGKNLQCKLSDFGASMHHARRPVSNEKHSVQKDGTQSARGNTLQHRNKIDTHSIGLLLSDVLLKIEQVADPEPIIKSIQESCPEHYDAYHVRCLTGIFQQLVLRCLEPCLVNRIDYGWLAVILRQLIVYIDTLY